MPPKPNYTREEITAAALELAAEKGISALTARDLGAALGISTRPIFTAFKNMDDVLAEVRLAAIARFNEYAEKAKEYSPVFKQIGLQMILFAQEQPKLFRLTFMSEKPEARSFDDVINNLGETATLCLDVLQKEYGLSAENAKTVFEHCWVSTFGICVLIATRACAFSIDEISDLLSREFHAILTFIKSGMADNCTVIPHKL
ncbi:MAG: TetR/AcrR family transcriptional regulator [Oscillospiraceae bacterium]|nr:TetR/AcrR family transcriptional regulator [Oscillospiraceae bacterium]